MRATGPCQFSVQLLFMTQDARSDQEPRNASSSSCTSATDSDTTAAAQQQAPATEPGDSAAVSGKFNVPKVIK